MKERTRRAGLALMLPIAWLCLDYLYFKPERARLALRRQDAVSLVGENARARLAAGDLDRVREEIDALRGRMSDDVPMSSPREGGRLLRHVQSLAVASGATVLRFTPRENEPGPDGSQAFVLQLAGTFDAIAGLFAMLGESPGLLHIRDFAMHAQDSSDDGGVVVDCVLLVVSRSMGAGEAMPGGEAANDGGGAATPIDEPQGRRDPFAKSLARTTADAVPPASSGEREGAGKEEVVLSGTLETPTGRVALLRVPSGATYMVRAGDRFMDALVESITSQGLVLASETGEKTERTLRSNSIEPHSRAESKE